MHVYCLSCCVKSWSKVCADHLRKMIPTNSARGWMTPPCFEYNCRPKQPATCAKRLYVAEGHDGERWKRLCQKLSIIHTKCRPRQAMKSGTELTKHGTHSTMELHWVQFSAGGVPLSSKILKG